MTRTREPIDFDGHGVFDIDESLIPEALREACLRCIAVQKASADLTTFRPNPNARDEVSDARLAEVLATERDVHGIASEREISNVIPFSARHIADAVRSDAVERERKAVDAGIAELVRGLFRQNRGLEVVSSGHLWYPPGSWMGWHTNSRVPGWRVYVNIAEPGGESLFRYRDPADGRVVTLHDREWNIRVFRIRADQPLWHAVYSGTNRFSMGYMVYRSSLRSRVLGRLRRILGVPARVGD